MVDFLLSMWVLEGGKGCDSISNMHSKKKPIPLSKPKTWTTPIQQLPSCECCFSTTTGGFFSNVGGWTNPFWNICSSNWIILVGVKISKYLSCHHLDIVEFVCWMNLQNRKKQTNRDSSHQPNPGCNLTTPPQKELTAGFTWKWGR